METSSKKYSWAAEIFFAKWCKIGWRIVSSLLHFFSFPSYLCTDTPLYLEQWVYDRKGSSKKCQEQGKMTANKGSERNQIHKKNLLLSTNPSICYCWNRFLVSLYSLSSKPGRFKENEKLEISSIMWVKELSRKFLSSQIQVLFLVLVLDQYIPERLSINAFLWKMSLTTEMSKGISYHWSRNVLLVWHSVLSRLVENSCLFIYLFPLALFNVFNK